MWRTSYESHLLVLMPDLNAEHVHVHVHAFIVTDQEVFRGEGHLGASPMVSSAHI